MAHPASVAAAVASQAQAEEAVRRVALLALEAWAAVALDAVLAPTRSLTADIEPPPPDPERIADTQHWWEALLDNVLGWGVSLVAGIELLAALGALGAMGPVNDAEAAAGRQGGEPPPTTRPTPRQVPAAMDVDALAARVLRIVADTHGLRVAEAAALDAQLAAMPTLRQLQARHLAGVRNRMAGTPDAVFRQIAAELDQALADGEHPRDMAVRVQALLSPQTGDWPGRAAAVARTETAAAMSAATLDAARYRRDVLGEDYRKMWLATRDTRTRKSHRDASGQVVELDGKFTVGGRDLEHPADPGAPPHLTVNCVPGWTRVSGNATALVKRRFRGVLLEVSTAAGHKLTATANHSVLTRRGWRPVGSLKPGDELAGTTKAWPPAGSVDPHVADSEPSIEQCANTMQLAGSRTERVPSGFVDLDGDIADAQVEIQRSDLTFAFGTYTEQLKKIGKLTVEGRHGEVRLADHESSLLRVGHADEGLLVPIPDRDAHTLQLARNPRPGHPQGGGHGLDGDAGLPQGGKLAVEAAGPRHVALVERPLAHPGVGQGAPNDIQAHADALADDVDREQLDLVEADDLVPVKRAPLRGCGADLDAGVLEAAGDHFPADTEAAGDAARGLPRVVQGDDFVPDLVSLPSGDCGWVVVTQVMPTAIDGHVFDLSTDEGFYLAEGIVSHNCRCRVVVLAADEEPPPEAFIPDPDDQTEDGGGLSASARAPDTQEAAMAETFRAFTAVLAPVGQPTDDGRRFAPDIKLRFRDFPLPLMWQRQSEPGHYASHVVGSIESAAVEDGNVVGSGYLLNTPEADEAAEQVRHKLTGPSVDLGDVEWVLTDEDGAELDEQTLEKVFWDDNPDGIRVFETVTSAVVMGATLVSVPAFGQVSIALSGEVERDEALTAAITAAGVARFEERFRPAATPVPVHRGHDRLLASLRALGVSSDQSGRNAKWPSHEPATHQSSASTASATSTAEAPGRADSAAHASTGASGTGCRCQTSTAPTAAALSNPSVGSATVQGATPAKPTETANSATPTGGSATQPTPNGAGEQRGRLPQAGEQPSVDDASTPNGGGATSESPNSNGSTSKNSCGCKGTVVPSATALSSSPPAEGSAPQTARTSTTTTTPGRSEGSSAHPATGDSARSATTLNSSGARWATSTSAEPESTSPMSRWLTQLAASAGGVPVAPPREWFQNPRFNGPTPLTVTDEGRLFAMLAPWGVCHVGIGDRCVTAPRSNTGYAYFTTGLVLCDDGSEVAVGHITLDTGHADPTLGYRPAAEHYDHTGTCVADVAVGEDEHGIWLAGAARPGLTDAQMRVLRSSPLSGDWRSVNGNLELVAALSVNTPGFPVPRGALAASGDRPLTLIASLGPRPTPPAPSGPSGPSRALVSRMAVEVARESIRLQRNIREAAAILASLDGAR